MHREYLYHAGMFTHSLAMKKRHLKEQPSSLASLLVVSMLLAGLVAVAASLAGDPGTPVQADVLRVDVVGQ